MPGLSIWLPALLGGFLFVRGFYQTRQWLQRSEGYRLLFAASVAGGILWFLAHASWWYAQQKGILTSVPRWWYEIVPAPDSLGSASAFLLGMALPPLLNLLRFVPMLSTERVQVRLTTDRADQLELLVRRALKDRSLLAITLKSGKVYVGRVVALPNPVVEPESLLIALSRSGYRETETHNLKLNVDYEDARHKSEFADLVAAYEALIDEQLREVTASGGEEMEKIQQIDRTFEKVFGKIDATYEDLPFTVVIMVREIQAVSPFDLEFFDNHFDTDR